MRFTCIPRKQKLSFFVCLNFVLESCCCCCFCCLVMETRHIQAEASLQGIQVNHKRLPKEMSGRKRAEIARKLIPQKGPKKSNEAQRKGKVIRKCKTFKSSQKSWSYWRERKIENDRVSKGVIARAFQLFGRDVQFHAAIGYRSPAPGLWNSHRAESIGKTPPVKKNNRRLPLDLEFYPFSGSVEVVWLRSLKSYLFMHPTFTHFAPW